MDGNLSFIKPRINKAHKPYGFTHPSNFLGRVLKPNKKINNEANNNKL